LIVFGGLLGNSSGRAKFLGPQRRLLLERQGGALQKKGDDLVSTIYL
jgi:hypothetical protein